jgi:MoaD family protein
MRVLLFAALRELAGASRLELELAPPDVATLIGQLTSAFGPRFGRIVAAGSVVVNGETAGPEHRLQPGDEVALLPPVSGGTDRGIPERDLPVQ